MTTRLKAVESPSFVMKLAYRFSKMKFGKVLGPLKMVYVKLPISFSLFSNKISQLERKMKLKRELVLLVRHLVAQINTCTFCMDIAIAISIKNNQQTEKFYHLQDFTESPLFTKAEKAALLFARELTHEKKISDVTFSRARQYYSERELIEIAWLVSTEHYYNLMNLAFDIHSDNLCQLVKRPKEAAIAQSH